MCVYLYIYIYIFFLHSDIPQTRQILNCRLAQSEMQLLQLELVRRIFDFFLGSIESYATDATSMISKGCLKNRNWLTCDSNNFDESDSPKPCGRNYVALGPLIRLANLPERFQLIEKMVRLLAAYSPQENSFLK